jgi:hypothetical protein
MPQLRRSTSIAWPPPPPSDETTAERNVRLEVEKEAKRVSDAIDHALGAEREQRQRKGRTAKILLLGETPFPVHPTHSATPFLCITPWKVRQSLASRPC